MAKPRKHQDGATPAPDSASAPTGRQSIHGDTADYGDRVSQRAYELYLARGRMDGQDFDDWLAAERELASSRDGGHRE
jgi:hypothetical protein